MRNSQGFSMQSALMTITPKAAERIAQTCAKKAENGQPVWFRIMVLGGGCSGFKYKFDYDVEKHPWDLEFTQGDAKVLVDDLSIQYIKEAELDYQNDLSGARFVVTNPNAASGCGCGVSFAVKMD